MSNKVYLVATEFKNLACEGITEGYRLYDNYSSTYNNCYGGDTGESIPEDDLDLLSLVVLDRDDDTINGILDYLDDEGHGIEINGNYYDWDEIKHIINPAESESQ